MTVKRLIELLHEAPPDMPVYVMVHNEGGLFGFAEACEGETGKSEIAPVEEGDYKIDEIHASADTIKVFAILPHGFAENSDHEPDYLSN